MDSTELMETFAVIEEMDEMIAALEEGSEVNLDLTDEGDDSNV